jgi:hypothetical protein
MDKARKYRWSDRVKELRDLIDTNCPMIYSGNWKAENEKGWRWVINLEVEDEDSKSTIKDYQTAHGPLNVAIGHPFNEDSNRPTPATSTFGLYVRDVEDLIKDIRRDLDDPAAIASWLNGD